MKTKKSDFTFTPAGYGHYNVIYESPATGKQWKATISDMPLIDATKNEPEPKTKDLDVLKWRVKNAVPKVWR